jgi:hypothetical protein
MQAQTVAAAVSWIRPMPPALDFQALFQHSPNPYMVIDRELRYVAANPAYLRVTGARLDDLLGRRIFDAFPHDPEDADNESARVLRQSFERVLSTCETDVIALIPYRVPATAGGPGALEERYWSASHTPILGDDGQVAYILQHTVDVTDMRRHASRQAESLQEDHQEQTAAAGLLGRAQRVQEKNVTLDVERRHLRRLFEQAPGFMAFLRGNDHVFEIANAGYYQLVGHRDIIGKSVRDAAGSPGPGILRTARSRARDRGSLCRSRHAPRAPALSRRGARGSVR